MPPARSPPRHRTRSSASHPVWDDDSAGLGRGVCDGFENAPDPAACANQVGDPVLPLQIGIWDALLALLRPGAEPDALARALRAYTRSTGYFLACARKDAMRLDGRAVEAVSEEHRTGALKAVQGRRRRPSARPATAEPASYTDSG